VLVSRGTFSPYWLPSRTRESHTHRQRVCSFVVDPIVSSEIYYITFSPEGKSLSLVQHLQHTTIIYRKIVIHHTKPVLMFIGCRRATWEGDSIQIHTHRSCLLQAVFDGVKNLGKYYRIDTLVCARPAKFYVHTACVF